MARVVVVGGGFGGLASAARLAKNGHEVTLLEAGDRLGGALGYVEQDGFRWDSGPTTTLLPAVLRDLFRKSGRPLEKELDLVAVEPVRQHRFEDDSVLDLPGGSRAAQMSAIDAAPRRRGRRGAGRRTSTPSPTTGRSLRRDWMERPYSPDHAGKHTKALLSTPADAAQGGAEGVQGRAAARRWRRTPRGWRATTRATCPPGWGCGPTSSRTSAPGPCPAAWARSPSTLDRPAGHPRRHGAHRHAGPRRRGPRGPRPSAYAPAQGEVDADHVVVAIDPRRLPALAPYVERTMPAIPPVVCHLGVVGEVPDLPHEVVLHGDPMLVLRTGGTAPDGAHAWTLLGRGRLAEDIVTALHRGGIRVRDLVEVRVDRSPRELVESWGGSPYGVLWQGRSTVTRRLGPTTPIPGVYAAGAHATPGAGLPSVGLSAALVAQVIGPA